MKLSLRIKELFLIPRFPSGSVSLEYCPAHRYEGLPTGEKEEIVDKGIEKQWPKDRPLRYSRENHLMDLMNYLF